VEKWEVSILSGKVKVDIPAATRRVEAEKVVERVSRDEWKRGILGEVHRTSHEEERECCKKIAVGKKGMFLVEVCWL